MAAAEGWDGAGLQTSPYIIEGYEINGTGHGICIYIGNTSCYFEVRNCSLHDSSDNYVEYYYDSGLVLLNVQNGNIFNNLLLSSNRYGIYVQASNNNTIANNTVTANDHYGIYLYNSYCITIVNNQVNSNKYFGIYLYNSGDSIIAGNTASSNQKGIWVYYSCGNNTITGNTVTLNNNQGIEIENSDGNRIAGNTATYNSDGILLTLSSNNTIINNIASNNEHTGIYSTGNHNNTIDSNNASSNMAYGIYLVNCINHIINKNSLFANEAYGIHFSGWSDNNTAVDNIVSNTGHSGVHVSLSSNNIITRNILQNNQWAGISIHRANGNKIENNSIISGGNGIFLLYSVNSTIINNSISNNIDDGIRLLTSVGSIISDNVLSWNSNNGIQLYSYGNYNNSIYQNIVSNNTYGISIDNAGDLPPGNIVYHNNIMDNLNQAIDGDNNSWDNGYPSGGNYWSDYNGADVYFGPNQDISGSDGIGDTPYVIDADSRDNYPMMEPNGALPFPDISISPSDISISNTGDCPCQWDEVIIDANVHNIGSLNATCTASIYLDSVSEESLIYREFEVSVPAGGSALLSHDWLANVAGNHTIIVNITDSNPPEENLANNQASKDIYISQPCGKLKVKASSDKQKYVSGIDDHAGIVVKVTYLGEKIPGASVSAWVIDPDGGNSSVQMTEASPGIFLGSYPFLVGSAGGTYRIKVIASKPGYLNGENDDSKDKFFLDSPVALTAVAVTPSVALGDDTVRVEVTGTGQMLGVLLREVSGDVVYSVPLYDDATHGDAVPSDGNFTVEISVDKLAHREYVVDVLAEEATYNARAGVSIAPSDSVMVDAMAFWTSGGDITIASPETNMTLELSLACDVVDASLVIFEHRMADAGKHYEIVASDDVMVAMELATMSATYVGEDIPVGVDEEDMRFNFYNPYISGYEPCLPGGVDTDGDVVWGDTEHFSEFVTSEVPVRFGMHVQNGWNLLSVPITTDAAGIIELLDDCGMGTKWDYILYYDSADAADHWKRYYTGWPSSFNDLAIIPAGAAFWLRVTDPADGLLVVDGRLPGPHSIQLRAGWNMVGYPTLTKGVSVAVALWGTGATMVEAFDQAAPYGTRAVGPTYVMKPGEGYWIYTATDSIWTVNW